MSSLGWWFADVIAEDVTEKITKRVTEEVTGEVTERVTGEVTERVTEEVTERVTMEKLVESVENTIDAFHVTLEAACNAMKATVEEYEQAKALLEIK